ncbi:hypothetical protein YC2023_002680 [Brassica napus]
MEKTTNHLHRQTVNSKKNDLTWRSKLGQQLQALQLLWQLKTQAISRNHNIVGGFGEEALFPVYWNGDNRLVLRVQKLLQNTWTFHIITRLDIFYWSMYQSKL